MPFRALYQAWCERQVPVGYCVACGIKKALCEERLQPELKYCSQRCQENYHSMLSVPALLGQPLSLGVNGAGDGVQQGHKRLLEPSVQDLDLWALLPDEVLVAILELSFPLRETSALQFVQLSAIRYVSQRYARLIDEQVYPRMERLPR